MAEQLSDEKIVEMYWHRSELAIKETEKKYKNYLLSIALNILHDVCDSEECLNDVYIGAWNNIPPQRPKSLQAFLTMIMRRKAIDCYRGRKRHKRFTSELLVSLTEVENIIADKKDVELEVDARELGKLISDFVRSLSERRMYIFMSRYYMARPIKEISKLIGCSESTVNKEIAHIKCALKEILEKEGYFI